MRGVAYSVSIPSEVAAAIRGEASRRFVREQDVLRDFLASELPGYIARQIADSFAGVIDAEIVDDDFRFDAERPRLTTGTDPNALTNATSVEPNTTWAGLDDEDAPGGIPG